MPALSAPGRLAPENTSPGLPVQPPGEDEAVPELEPDGGVVVEMPMIESIELTDDLARRSVDVFMVLKEKYRDSDIGEYESLEQFVEETDTGKQLAADLKHNGFDSVTDWNSAIMSVSFAYSALLSDQEADLRRQIEEVRTDPNLDEGFKQHLMASLAAMIPSENNKAVVQRLMAEPGYEAKLKAVIEDEEE